MAETLFPSVLVSGREDGRLANSDNIYDKLQALMQESLNKVLARYFNFATGSFKGGGLDGGNLKAGTVGVEALSEELRAVVEGSSVVAALVAQVRQLQLDRDALQQRVYDLETDSLLRDCEKAGFFLVDEAGYIGAAAVPSGSEPDGGYLFLGFDGDRAPQGFSHVYLGGGGKCLLVRGADYSESGWGSIDGEEALQGLSIGSAGSYSGREFELKCYTNPSGYKGAVRWEVLEGSEHVVLKESWGHVAVFTILEGANGSNVRIRCTAVDYPSVRDSVTVGVTYEARAERLSVALSGSMRNSYEVPVHDTQFELLATVSPADAAYDESAIAWVIEEGGSYVNGSANGSRGTFVMKSFSGTKEVVIHAELTLSDGTVLRSASKSVWIYYQEAGQTPPDEIVITGHDSVQTTASQQLQVATIPAGRSAGTVTWEVLSGAAQIDSKGVLTVSETAERGEVIVVGATSSAMAGKDTPETAADADAVAIIENQFVPALSSLRIDADGDAVSGKGVQLEAVPTPYREEFLGVAWSVVEGGDAASIDDFGYLSFRRGVTDEYVKVKAVSRVNPAVSATAELQVSYDDSGRDICYLLQRAVVAGEHVDFQAEGHTRRTLDGATVVNADEVTWEAYRDDGSTPTVAYSAKKRARAAAPAAAWQRLSEDGHGNLARLVLDEEEGVQRWVVRCYLTDTPSISREEVYEFERVAGKKPVMDIVLDMSEAGLAYKPLEVEAPQESKWYDLKKYVKPVVGAGETEDDYLFNPANVVFKHTNSDNCLLFNGRMLVNEDTVAGEETWTLGYRHIGDSSWDAESCRVKREFRVTLSRRQQVLSAEGIQIVSADQYVGQVEGQPIDGGQLSVVDQNGNVVVDQDGNRVKAVFSVTEGREYCSVNCYGYDLRIYDTGGEWRQVTVKAVVGKLVATKTFEVRLK